MRADGSAGEDGGMFWLYGPDFHVGILGFEGFPNACDGTAGADAGAEAMDRAICLGKDFQARLGTVDRRVGRILKLLGNSPSSPFSSANCA